MNDLEKQIETGDYGADLASVNILMQKQQVIFRIDSFYVKREIMGKTEPFRQRYFCGERRICEKQEFSSELRAKVKTQEKKKYNSRFS